MITITIIATTAAVSTALTTIVSYRNRDSLRTRFGPTIKSRVVQLFSSKPNHDFRQTFKDCGALTQFKHSTPRNHSHPTAASLRCLANTLMRQFIRRVGYDQYSVSMSKSEQRARTQGSRLYYDAKDIQMEYQSDKITSNSIITMTDVDYYLDLDKYLTGHNVLIFTFVPTSVAGPTSDGVFATVGNEVQVLVNGGAEYRHELWNYETDHLVSDHWWGSAFYLIEQIRVSEDRRVIFLNHIRNVYGPVGWFMSGKRLRRRQLSIKDIPFQRFLKTDNKVTSCYYSFAKAGEFMSANISTEAYSSAVTRLLYTKDPHLSDVERIFNTYKVPNSLYAATTFFDIFIRQRSILGTVPPVISECVDQHSYQTLHPLVTEDGKPSMRALWPGYVKTSFAPVKSFNNDHACIKGRIEEPRNQRRQLPVIAGDLLKEFVDFLIPPHMVHTLAPEDFEFMYDNFDRPTQRALIRKVENTMIMDKAIVRSFQKAETYAKIAAPRNISTLPMDHNMKLGQFMYPFMCEILKKTHWYAFGSHPSEVSRRLLEKAQKKLFALLTDYDKLDGSIQEFHREILTACMSRAFHPRYIDEIIRLENKERYVKAWTAEGVNYETNSTILSGSIITSILGSLVNAFTSYAALRLTRPPQEAWDNLGSYGGDDGMTFDLEPKHMQQVAAQYGLAVTAERAEAGAPLKFLGRWYLDPWTTNQSFCDVARQFRKLHLTATPKIVPDEVVLFRKALGIITTDTNSPLVTPWAKAVIRIVGDQSNHKLFRMTTVDESYNSKFGTYDAPTDDVLMYSIVAKDMELEVSEIKEIEKKFNRATKLKDLYLDEIVRTPQTIQLNAVNRGNLVTPNKIKQHQQAKVDENLSIRTGVCKFLDKCTNRKCRFKHPRRVK